ncbi:3-methyl-2-oxobutanoate hydroxymethyltransferase [Alicyclobacillus sp.]|uniref:3-methyl-2-oxobutanoate hydroxymethyltransferase n=1 Tax=Alicyclobacillus sp. TaxID=61169 RepID=UPI0025C6678C|nr:3-methyl-2-oxobutanoate hydroxymethyltransferase [Alicyclobacillus sp.]MCL6516286.1 3-methyl-2-oxobutanoate hydroxymethyltransferase [Alicyclobacillus sp.]
MESRVTVRTLIDMKKSGQKIAMMTAYDHPTAQLLDEAGLHVLLVGDSLGMVVQGGSDTVGVTLDHVVYHTRWVSRGATHALVVADLPFLTAHLERVDVLRAAGRLMQEGGAQAVKLEGGTEVAPVVRELVQAGIPVMGHIGLTPQSVHAIGGFRVQGRTVDSASRLLTSAMALEEAGAFAIVLEMMPAEVAEFITERLSIPTIGIGAGPGCDGQVLVFHDMMGFTSGYIPRHNKRYADLADVIRNAARTYVQEVAAGVFPGEPQTVRLRPNERAAWENWCSAQAETEGGK